MLLIIIKVKIASYLTKYRFFLNYMFLNLLDKFVNKF